MKISSIVTYDKIDYTAEFEFINIDKIEMTGDQELLEFLGVDRLLFTYNSKDIILLGSTLYGQIELIEPIYKALLNKLIELEYV